MNKKSSLRFILMTIISALLIFSSGCKKENKITETDIIVPDIDGNIYNKVTIGNQVWIKENLKTTRFNNGSSIPLVPDDVDWKNLSTPGYCWFNNDLASKDDYGALYNWYVVSKGNLCPSGWHIPSDDEWSILSNYLGGDEIAGGKMKDTNTVTWLDPITEGTNESGFTGFPVGDRSPNGSFDNISWAGFWWSCSPANTGFAFNIWLISNSSKLWRGSSIYNFGFYIRCIKDD